MIRFSVVIPLYNKANYVLKTIECVLNQTFFDFEIIVVNDGSTDNSLSVVNEINDDRIRVFSKENEGVALARNFGIGKAQHEYIAFLDADDLWLPDYLETIKGMIEQYPQAGIFSTSFTIDYLGRKSIMINHNMPEGETLLIDNYCKSVMNDEIQQLWTGVVCVKKNLFDQMDGFRKVFQPGEDIDMWLRLSFVSPIIWKNESKAIYYHVSENNISSYKGMIPFWKWYTYGSSIYLKMYTNRTLINSLKKVNYKDKIYLFTKINWFYVCTHLVYNFRRKRGKR